MQISSRAALLMVMCAVLWGGHYPAAAVAIDDISPYLLDISALGCVGDAPVRASAGH